MNKKEIYPSFKELKESSDINEVVRLLSTDEWIAICAFHKSKRVTFVLGRIN